MEEWKGVLGYEGSYEVSNMGNVRSVDRYVDKILKGKQTKEFKKGKILKLGKHITNGRFRVELYNKDNSSKKHSIHRLVLEAFIGPCPEGMECCHRDDNPSNNRLDNLYWGTRKDNMEDKIKNGRTKRVHIITKNHKLKSDEVWLIKKLIHNKIEQNTIAKMFKVSPQTICDIKHGRRWSHITYNEDEERKKIK